MPFPKDFIWGSATSSYQIEGGGLSEGRGESIWDRFSHTPGKIKNNDNGDIACDHLHRYPQDIALMKDLGLVAYRFSIAWSRVIPAGTGATNPAGLDFYDRVVDELLKQGIAPYATLYHWDLPQALQDRGGWENRDSIKWFVDYADLMTRRLGDRIKNWTTLNEPSIISFLANYVGIHAPGKKDLAAAMKVAHHVMLAHGAAIPVIRRNVPDTKAGITIDLGYFDPLTDSPEDKQAAWNEDGFKNRWFLDTTFKGEYPADIVALCGDVLEGIDLSEAKNIAAPVDFLGINYYTRSVIKGSPHGRFKSEWVHLDNVPRTDFQWEIYPDGLRNLLVRVWKEYQPKIMYVTENGAGYHDPAPVNGCVEDTGRVEYYRSHLKACEEAIAQGVPLNGYFAWSLLDNFEWAEGYQMRFGLTYVDFETQERTLKRSGHVYRDIIKNGL
jgi:beta-glucosidase